MDWCALFNCKCDDVSSVWDILPSCDNDCGNCEFRVEVDSTQSEQIVANRKEDKMKLKQFNFNTIPVKGLSIFVDDKEVACGFIGEVLKKIPHLKEREIKSANYYFDIFVIRL